MYFKASISVPVSECLFVKDLIISFGDLQPTQSNYKPSDSAFMCLRSSLYAVAVMQ